MSDDLRQRLVALELDRLDPEAAEELLVHLARDPAARRVLVEEWSLSGELSRVLRVGGPPASGGGGSASLRRALHRRRQRRPRRRRAGVVVAATAVLAALVAVALLPGRGPAPIAEVVAVDAGAVGLAVGDPLAAGTTVTGDLTLRLVAGGEVVLSDAELRLAADRLELVTGRIDLEVPPRPQDPLVVASPHGTVRVVGTGFSVQLGPLGTRVAVAHGRVRAVVADGPGVDLEAGRYLVMEPGRSPTVRALPDAATALVVTSHEQPSRGEAAYIERLQRLGFAPRLIDAGRGSSLDAVGAGLVLISNESVLPYLEQRWSRLPAPALVLEPGAVALYGLGRTADPDTRTLSGAVRSAAGAAGLLDGRERWQLTRGETAFGVGIGVAAEHRVLVAAEDPAATILAAVDGRPRLVFAGLRTDETDRFTAEAWEVLERSLRWLRP